MFFMYNNFLCIIKNLTQQEKTTWIQTCSYPSNLNLENNEKFSFRKKLFVDVVKLKEKHGKVGFSCFIHKGES